MRSPAPGGRAGKGLRIVRATVETMPPTSTIRAITAALAVLTVASGVATRDGDHATGARPAASPPVAGGVIDLQRLTGPITLDGLSDEPAWLEVDSLHLTMYEPTYAGDSPRRIVLRVAYDDQAIYVEARFLHDDPSEIRAFLGNHATPER
jgi:hypothetical protein